jgi:tetratricopeptide (TPR) repeat protein
LEYCRSDLRWPAEPAAFAGSAQAHEEDMNIWNALNHLPRSRLRNGNTVASRGNPSGGRRTPRWALAVLLAGLALLPGNAAAQAFDADRYHRQCLAFEQGGDYETARQSCLNALAVNPDHLQARIALARIELALGDLAEAESALLQIVGESRGPEPHLLLAEVYSRSERYPQAETALAEAGRRIVASGRQDLAGRLAFLRGDLAERRGRFTEALRHYQDAVRLQPGERLNYVRLASLLLEMGDADDAQAKLEEYLAPGRPTDAEVSSLLGRSLWAQGELEAAARELERSLSLRTAREGAVQARDLRALGLIYYALGDTRAGGLAIREATRRGNLFTTFFSGNLAWLLLLLLLLAVHLVGESRIGTTSSPETGDGPRQWSVGQVYMVAWTALLVALPLAVGYGALRYDNLLALLTPVQSSDTRAVFFIVFSLMAAWGARRRARLNGWLPGPALTSGGERVPAGILLGAVMLAATLAYLKYVPSREWRGDFFLDLAHLTPAVAAALVLIPFSEIFFRAFAFPAFESRYGTGFAVLISGSLSALLFANPALLLLAFGLVLSSAYRSTRSGALTLAAQLTLHLGLLAAVLLLPWARSLFV